ncbi:MAG: hypothetical protein FD180_704 [Planctomycetota bacterium]|nr:MAG: hypothetical protein FD180_704 [Planctomycetota bacterium]
MRDVDELVKRSQAGDRAAMGELVAAVQDDIWRLELSHLRSEPDAEDATQETFARMIESLGGLRDARAFRGWLYRIALNQAHETGRRRAAEAKALAAAASTSQENREADAMERSELAQSVRLAVKGLEQSLRTTVELRYEHGLAYADIARAMECPEGTVADRLHTAHERLKRALAGAGVAITMALLETELSAAPRTGAPARLASRLEKLSRDARPAAPGGPNRPTVGIAAAVAVLLAIGVWYAFHRFGPLGSGAQDSAQGHVAERGASGNGEGATNSPSTADAARNNANDAARTDSTAAASSQLAVVEGHVRDSRDGRPVEGARVWLTGKQLSGEAGPSTTTGADGAFRLEATAGDYDLHAFATGFLDYLIERRIDEVRARKAGEIKEPNAAGESVWRLKLPEGGHVSREIELKSGVAIRGRVVDARGGLVAGAKVTFEMQYIDWEGLQNGCTFGYCPDGSARSVTTDFEGRFLFHGIYPRGKAVISANREGFDDGSEEVALAGADADIVITLLPGLEIAGEVVDHLGAPVAGAVLLLGSPGELASNLEQQKLRTDAEGRFSLIDCPRTTNLVAAYAPGHGWVLLDFSALDAKHLKLTLPQANGALKGRVRDGRGLPIAGALIRVASFELRGEGANGRLGFGGMVGWSEDEGPQAVGTLGVDGPGGEILSREDGTFEINGLPVSTGTPIQLEISKDGYEQFEQTVTAEGWLDIEMSPGK